MSDFSLAMSTYSNRAILFELVAMIYQNLKLRLPLRLNLAENLQTRKEGLSRKTVGKASKLEFLRENIILLEQINEWVMKVHQDSLNIMLNVIPTKLLLLGLVKVWLGLKARSKVKPLLKKLSLLFWN